MVKSRHVTQTQTPVYSPTLQRWRVIDGLFRENRHLEMLLLYFVAALFCRLLHVKEIEG